MEIGLNQLCARYLRRYGFFASPRRFGAGFLSAVFSPDFKCKPRVAQRLRSPTMRFRAGKLRRRGILAISTATSGFEPACRGAVQHAGPVAKGVSKVRPIPNLIGAYRLAAGPRHQCREDADRHALADEADRAIAEERVGAAGVEAVDLAGPIHAGSLKMLAKMPMRSEERRVGDV